MTTTQDLDRMLAEMVPSFRGLGTAGDSNDEMELKSVTLSARLEPKDAEYRHRVGKRAGYVAIERDGREVVLTPSAPRALAVRLNAQDLEKVLVLLRGLGPDDDETTDWTCPRCGVAFLAHSPNHACEGQES